MREPRKIRVLYFDESYNTLERFMSFCGCKDIIETIGTFRSFNEIAPFLEQDGYGFLNLLNLDVIVIRIDNTKADICAEIQTLKRYCHVKLIGILTAERAKDRSLISALDYYTEEAGADNIVTDEDVYTRLLYQIKTARLAKSTEQVGVRGRWAILPLPKQVNRRRFDVIAIGASAGGTDALTTILSALPATLPPMLVVQHMPDNFSEFFAKNLAARVNARVVLAKDGEMLEDGTVYLGGYGKHLEIVKCENGAYMTRCTDGEKVSGHRPSVDTLFRSVAKAAGDAAMGVILTGMGSDGAQGLLEMREAGAYTIGQDKETCTVYGMPMVAYSLGAVSKQLPLGSIAKAILSAASQN